MHIITAETQEEFIQQLHLWMEEKLDNLGEYWNYFEVTAFGIHELRRYFFLDRRLIIWQ